MAMDYPRFGDWNEARRQLRCFKCGSDMMNMQERTGPNGGPPSPAGEGEHRAQCGTCGFYTYFDVVPPTSSDEEQLCISCGRELSEVGVCCSDASYDDGTHDDALCPGCCGPHLPEPKGRVYYPQG